MLMRRDKNRASAKQSHANKAKHASERDDRLNALLAVVSKQDDRINALRVVVLKRDNTIRDMEAHNVKLRDTLVETCRSETSAGGISCEMDI
jgi:hypothetical protein